ncbi:unnamed protein product [Linum trigynum]
MSSSELVEAVEQEVMLPGFRFHPTDEELVGFYLKRKTQLRPLSIDLIKQLDIYKYDPWDLPKMATGTGEKEWYFFCPRDRKYRNSARPNRVTGSGFWKATGTDRPIYSSEGNKYCIGLKKSLVFYKGRAAKGMKTDWMMHEFRLPSLAAVAAGHHSSKRFVDTTIQPNDAWAICRIFKKTSSTAQRALSQSWVSPSLVQEEAALPTSTTPNCFTQSFMSSATTTTTAPSFPPIHRLSFDYNYNDNNYYASPDFYSFKPINNSIIPLAPKPSYHLHTYPYSTAADHESSANFSSAKCTSDLSSVLLNMPSSSSLSSMLVGNHFKQQAGGGGGGDRESMSSSVDQFSNGSQHSNGNGGNIVTSNGGAISSSSLISGSSHDPASIMMSTTTKSPDLAHIDGLPFSYLGHDGCSTPTTAAWKQNLLLWDYANYSSPTFPGSDQVATTFSTTKCYN